MEFSKVFITKGGKHSCLFALARIEVCASRFELLIRYYEQEGFRSEQFFSSPISNEGQTSVAFYRPEELYPEFYLSLVIYNQP